jgi:hypothetical protein
MLYATFIQYCCYNTVIKHCLRLKVDLYSASQDLSSFSLPHLLYTRHEFRSFTGDIFTLGVWQMALMFRRRPNVHTFTTYNASKIYLTFLTRKCTLCTRLAFNVQVATVVDICNWMLPPWSWYCLKGFGFLPGVNFWCITNVSGTVFCPIFRVLGSRPVLACSF